MSFVAVGAGIAAVSAGYSIYSGVKQSKEAKRLREGAVDPGYEVNQALVDNARIMGDRYGNYTLPGYEAMKANVNQSAGQAFSQGVQGASSSGDVLDLAARIAYGQQQGLNQVEMANAQGRDQALLQYLDANVAAGQQYQSQNEYERQRYQEQLREAAALQQAGAVNTAQGADSLAGIGTSLALSAYGNRQLQEPNAPVVSNQGSVFGNANSTTNTSSPAPPSIGSNQAGMAASGLIADEYRKKLRESLMSKAPSITPLIRR